MPTTITLDGSETTTITEDGKDCVFQDKDTLEILSFSVGSAKIPDVEVWVEGRGRTELLWCLDRDQVDSLMRYLANWLDATPPS